MQFRCNLGGAKEFRCFFWQLFVSKYSIYFLRNLRPIRSFHSKQFWDYNPRFATPRLDYCNFCLLSYQLLLYILSKTALLACYIVAKPTYITLILRDFYWFSIKSLIHFKIFLITYKTPNYLPVSYLSNSIMLSQPKRLLRLASLPHPTFLLSHRANSSRMGDRASSVIAPKLWNLLHLNVHLPSDIFVFKPSFKTRLPKNLRIYEWNLFVMPN